jgi:hypothetical protein
MRDPARIEKLLARLAAVWREHPDLRLGQLVVDVVNAAEPAPTIFYVEDDEFLRRLELFAGRQRELRP